MATVTRVFATGVWRRLSAAFCGAVLAACSFFMPAQAMQVSPMVTELTLSGAGSAARIEVSNVGSAALPFETAVTRIDFDKDGKLVETPAEQDFLVFPPQGLVPVGGRQVVRLQWLGAPDLKTSQAYYLSIRQLPVQTTTESTSGGALNLQVLYNMKALVTVAPRGAEPKVEVVSVTPASVTMAPPPVVIDSSLTGGAPTTAAPPAAQQPQPVPGLRVRVRNVGNRYALMSGASWTVDGTTTDGKPISFRLTSDNLNQSVGVGYLAPAGGERVFDIPTGVELAPNTPIRIRFGQ